jgi:hypothetical protein
VANSGESLRAIENRQEDRLGVVGRHQSQEARLRPRLALVAGDNYTRGLASSFGMTLMAYLILNIYCSRY